MPQKSQYIQAPFTVEQLAQAVKDDFAFLGADVNQTSDNDIAFDHGYWLSKVTKSTKNKIPQSEQLVWPLEFPDYYAPFVINSPNTGMDAYVEKNNDSSVPFQIYNVFVPRPGQGDGWLRYNLTGLKSSTNYTFSYWAKTGSSTTGLQFSAGRDSNNPKEWSNTTHTIGQAWERKSATFNTGLYNTLCLHLGGWNSWMYVDVSKNIAKYSESIYDWSFYYGTYQRIRGTQAPPTGYAGLNADVIDAPGGADSVYITIPTGAAIGGRTFTLSAWVKPMSTYDSFIQITSGSVSVGSSQVAVGGTQGEWKRVYVTWTVPAGQTENSLRIRLGSNSRFHNSVWGVQLEESAVMTDYAPAPYDVSTGSITLNGDLHIAGFQLEEGSSATAYESNNCWFYKELPAPLVVDEILVNEAVNVSYAIPAGVSHSFMSVMGSRTLSDVYKGNGAVTNSASHFDGSGNFSPSTKYSVLHKNGFSANPNMYVSSTYRIQHPSDMLKAVQGPYSSNPSPLGDVHYSFGPDASDIGNAATYKLKFTVKGVVFRVSDKGTDFGSGSDWGQLRGVNAHIKTPGNGHRKLISTSLIGHSTNGNIQINQFMPTYGSNARTNVAEYDNGFLSPTLSFKQVSDSRTDHWYNRIRNVYGSANFLSANARMHNSTVNRNTDLFSFTEGASDGFLYALNANSTFVLNAMYADLVNSVLPGDDGTKYSRITSGYIITDMNYIHAWCVHGPYHTVLQTNGMANFKGSGGKKTTNVMPDYFELFGENTEAVNKKLIYPIFAAQANNAYATLRGQVKNFYLTSFLNFSGNTGDLMIGVDGSKYFCFAKLDEQFWISGYGYMKSDRASILFVKV